MDFLSDVVDDGLDLIHEVTGVDQISSSDDD